MVNCKRNIIMNNIKISVPFRALSFTIVIGLQHPTGADALPCKKACQAAHMACPLRCNEEYTKATQRFACHEACEESFKSCGAPSRNQSCLDACRIARVGCDLAMPWGYRLGNHKRFWDAGCHFSQEACNTLARAGGQNLTQKKPLKQQ